MMEVMQREDWERLGRAFAEARDAAGLKQTEVAEQIGVSRTPIQAIERGRQSNGTPFTKVTGTMREYAQLVGWTKESPQRVLDGQPPEQSPKTPAVVERSKSDLPAAIDRELRSGKYVDGAVIHLNPEDEDDDTRIIVVLKSDEDISDEELDRRWQQWRRSRRHLQGLAASDPEAPRGS